MRSIVRTACAAVLVAVAPPGVGAAIAPPPVTYAAPAGALPAGHLGGLTYNAVLPSGRQVTPAGRSVVVGMDALGVALSPDGRFAIVSNDAERGAEIRSAVDPSTFGGYSLAVVDTETMTVVDRYRAPGESYFAGVTALRDPQESARTLVLAAGGASNAVYAFTLGADGKLAPDRNHTIAVPGPRDAGFADAGRSFPATLTAAPDGRHAYVVNQLGGSVAAIDTATRRLAGAPRSVGFFPFGLALAGPRVLVTNEGLLRYGTLAAPLAAPPFRTTPPDPARASSLSLVGLAADGTFAGDAVAAVPMDPTPDGLRTVGGAHPTAVVATPNGGFAFISMAGVDRIATVELGAAPRVAGGVELRLFDRGPYGTQPTALALSRDGSRLYVALTGLDAVAVIDAHDPVHLHRLGLIPTGWAPSALALSADDRTLFVANAKGFGHDNGFTGDPSTQGDANAVWATLQRIDLADVRLVEATRATLAATRRVAAKAPAYPAAIRNVVLIVEDRKTFDAVLGDLGYGPADPAFVTFGESVTPNLHALARRFALAGNFFADAEESDAGAQFVTAGIAMPYTARTAPLANGRAPFVHQNPEDYPRAGYIFHALARHNISFRDYGALVRVAGYTADVTGAGGPSGRYTLDVPAPAILDGHVDLRYPGPNPGVRDEQRADEFIRDFAVQVASAQVPRFTAIWLPAGPGLPAAAAPPAAEQVADGDRALGKIVSYLSQLPSWRNTAIFVLPTDAQGARDHVDEHRTYALVISPYAKRRYVGMQHTSTASVLKTIDGIFRLPALSLGDLLATDMSDFFTATPDPRPVEAIAVPAQTSGRNLPGAP